MAGEGPTVRAAGCVVWRRGRKQPEVVVVHRPKYDDWSFPKGKLEPGESPVAAAVREVREETGLRVRVGPRLRDDRYVVESSGQPKVVSYWAARAPKGADVSSYEANAEVDGVAWLPLSKAGRRLTYPRDAELLDELCESAYDSSVLLVVRHCEARKRSTWHADDKERPLAAEGRRSAARLVPVLAAYGITRVVTSDAARCVETMAPYVEYHGAKMRREPRLSEEDATDDALTGLAATFLASSKRLAVCTHRPVLPRLCAALGFPCEEIDPGAMIVVHRLGGKVLSVERPG